MSILSTSNSMLLSQKSLDFLWEKQSVILNNISNDDTPGYKAKYVTFEEEIRSRLGSVNSLSRNNIRDKIMDSKITIHNTRNETDRLDGNNVDVDVESVELARSQIQYSYIAETLSRDAARLRTAITGQ